jgi:signal transduction histidine kinase
LHRFTQRWSVRVGLSEFVRANLAVIVQEWEQFARTIEPPALHMNSVELRDWSEHLLLAIADEMSEPQSAEEQALKAKGLKPDHAPKLTRHSHIHAAERLMEGFTIDQLISEYRALRATVIRLWSDACASTQQRVSPYELIRFNEAIDQSLIESVNQFSMRLEHARDLFIGSLTHDLRDPLSAIRLSVEILLHAEQDLDAEAVRSVVRIRDSADGMQRMIDELLDFARTRLGGRLPICPEPLDLGKLCRTLVEELEALDPATKVALHVEGDLGGVWDRTRIEQAIANLLSSATTHCGEDLPVSLRLEGAGDEVVLVVHSEAGRFPDEQRLEPLDPLPRDDLEPERGMGLGLYIARQVFETHGGRLTVRSPAQGGTRFELRLPRWSRAESSRTPPAGVA